MSSSLSSLKSEILLLKKKLEANTTTSFPTPEQLFQSYIPLEVAKPFHSSPCRYKSILAGVQSGKSFTTAMEFLKKILEDRIKKKGRLLYWCVSPSYPLTRRQETLLRSFLSQVPGLLVGESKSERILKLRGNIIIQFKSGDRPDLLVAEPVSGMWVDEIARLKESAWIDNLEGRTTSTLGWHLFSSSSRGRNWFYKTLLKPAEEHNPDYFFTTWKTSDNTAIPGIAAECARKKLLLPPALYEREYCASLDAFEGQVYEEWDPKIHVTVARPTKPYRDVLYAIDIGFSPHPGALVVVVEDKDRRYWVVEELVAKGQLLEWWVLKTEELMKIWGPGIVKYDPSRPECHAEYRKRGLRSSKANNSVMMGIETVMKSLHLIDGVPGLRVHESCKHLQNEFSTYRWGKNEQPVKENDDAIDALRYAIHKPRLVVRGMGDR